MWFDDNIHSTYIAHQKCCSVHGVSSEFYFIQALHFIGTNTCTHTNARMDSFRGILYILRLSSKCIIVLCIVPNSNYIGTTNIYFKIIIIIFDNKQMKLLLTNNLQARFLPFSSATFLSDSFDDIHELKVNDMYGARFSLKTQYITQQLLKLTIYWHVANIVAAVVPRSNALTYII